MAPPTWGPAASRECFALSGGAATEFARNEVKDMSGAVIPGGTMDPSEVAYETEDASPLHTSPGSTKYRKNSSALRASRADYRYRRKSGNSGCSLRQSKNLSRGENGKEQLMYTSSSDKESRTEEEDTDYDERVILPSVEKRLPRRTSRHREEEEERVDQSPSSLKRRNGNFSPSRGETPSPVTA